MTSTDTKKRPRRMARERSTEVTALAQSRETGVQTQRVSNAVVPSKMPTKCEKILNLLKREQGATLEEFVEATGWLPHTARAALTGLRERGHAIERSKTEGVSRYSVKEAVVSNLGEELEALLAIPPAALRAEWHKLFRTPAPALGPDALRRSLAWKKQARVHAGLPSSTR